MHKELIIDFKDLRSLDIACHKCGLRMILDVSSDNVQVPTFCPGCRTDFDPVSFVASLKRYIGAYRTICDLQQKFTFRVPVE